MSDAFINIDQAREAWLNNKLVASDINANNWVVHQWLYFLNNMPKTLTHKQLDDLDDAFDFTHSTNNEIAHSWLKICIQQWYKPAFERLNNYLLTIGRSKLVSPLYEALSKTPEGLKIAKAVFEKAKPGYHPLTIKTNKKHLE